MTADAEAAPVEIDAKAISAAVVNEALAAAAEVGVPAAEAFDRLHVEELRLAGCTKADARSYFESVFGPRRVRRGGQNVRVVDALVSDLDSYGEWSE